MKLYKITFYCMNFNGLKLDDIKNIIDNDKYILLSKFKGETVDIGEWNDDNPLNYNDTPIEAFEKYFEVNKKEDDKK